MPQKINVNLHHAHGQRPVPLLGRQIGGKLAEAKARALFRKFVKASARIEIRPNQIEGRIGRRA